MARAYIFLLLQLLLQLFYTVGTKVENLQILDRILKNGYDRRFAPTKYLNNATSVHCELYIKGFGPVSPFSMDYDVDLYLRQKWVDERLRYGNTTEILDLNDSNIIKAIWKPEVYFPNSKHAEFQFVTVPNLLVRISNEGEILYILRLQLTFSCVMELSKFPMDNQVCTIEIASFSKTVEELKLFWKTNNPVILDKGLDIPEFEIIELSTSECHDSLQIDNYSCLVAKFYLSRCMGIHLFQSYLPTTLIVVISWVSFWMDIDSLLSRTILGFATLLAMSSQTAGILTGLPQVSYLKAIDVWLGTCTAFVFCALLEFTFVNHMWRKSFPNIPRSTAIGLDGMDRMGETLTEIRKEVITDISSKGFNSNKYFLMAQRVDEYSRIFFPSIFVVFNVFYWSYYLL